MSLPCDVTDQDLNCEEDLSWEHNTILLLMCKN